MQLEAKIAVKSFALSDEGEITSGLFTIVGNFDLLSHWLFLHGINEFFIYILLKKIASFLLY